MRKILKVLGLTLLLVLALCVAVTVSGSSGTVGAPASGSASDSTSGSAPQAPNAQLTVNFLDVGQGDATLLESQGHWLLIDGGPADASRKVYATLKSLGVEKLDAVIATHPDADHIAGISAALNYASCGALYCSVDHADSAAFDDMARYGQSNGAGITVPSDGDSFTLGAATVAFMRANRSFSDDNNNSLIVRVTCGNNAFLFMGDAEQEAEKALLSEGKNLAATVLHVSHHGSLDATSEAFIKAVNPQYAVVSVGANDYGHPSERVMERLVSAGANVLRTDQVGDITMVCAGEGGLELKTERTATVAPTAPGVVKTPADEESAAEADSQVSEDAEASLAATHSYVLNISTMKFHYPDCDAVAKMAEKNRKLVEATRDEVRSWGYDPCGICKP